MKYLIAHDLGTSGNKASLFTTQGDMVASATISYPLFCSNDNHAEQDPEDWWKAVVESTNKLVENIEASDVIGISFSGQMQCCLIVDKAGKPLRNAMIWADMRAKKEAEKLGDIIGPDRIHQITGHRISESYSLEKLMWIKANEPELFEKTRYMLQVKDYIIYKMTGVFVTDYSDASGTNALDLKGRQWSEEIFKAADIPMAIMPDIKESRDLAGYLTEEAAKLLGLHRGVKVIVGGGDGPCSALGAGCIEENQFFLTYGTSAWIGGTTKDVFIDPDQTLFCFAHVIPGFYMPCGTTQSAGSTYTYIKDTLCRSEIEQAKFSGINEFKVMDDYILSSPPGSQHLLFLPYLLGERSPRWNPKCSGSYIGIKMHHTKADFIRASLEGIGMNLELILKAYRKKIDINSLVFTGGGAKSDLVTHLLADILEVDLIRLEKAENATSIAAAVIAGVGVGVFKDFSAIKNFIKTKDTVSMNEAQRPIYRELKKTFDKVYYALEDIYELF